MTAIKYYFFIYYKLWNNVLVSGYMLLFSSLMSFYSIFIFLIRISEFFRSFLHSIKIYKYEKCQKQQKKLFCHSFFFFFFSFLYLLLVIHSFFRSYYLHIINIKSITWCVCWVLWDTLPPRLHTPTHFLMSLFYEFFFSPPQITTQTIIL